MHLHASSAPCRFDAKCTKRNCTFSHANRKACRDGWECSTLGCTFTHPASRPSPQPVDETEARWTLLRKLPSQYWQWDLPKLTLGEIQAYLDYCLALEKEAEDHAEYQSILDEEEVIAAAPPDYEEVEDDDDDHGLQEALDEMEMAIQNEQLCLEAEASLHAC